MKKILIVNNNMKIGGVQKALVNLLKEIGDQAEVTLLLFSKTGTLLSDVPKNVSIIEATSDYRLLGISQKECHDFFIKIRRAFYVTVSRIFGFGYAVKFLNRKNEKVCKQHYDLAISYLHPAGEFDFYGGTAQFVLQKVCASRKAVFVHCDYLSCGAHCDYNDNIYRQFDYVGCVSRSVKSNFIRAIPDLSNKCIVIPNVLNKVSLRTLAQEAIPFSHKGVVKLLSVSRLSPEKGVARVINALSQIDFPFHYVIVGDGPCRNDIQNLIQKNGLLHKVTLIGEDVNPYRYMCWADILLLPSHHEAAPLVFQEALALGLPIFTTRTLSADELVGAKGFVVENNDESIATELKRLIASPVLIEEKRKAILAESYEFRLDWGAFSRLFE